MVNGASPGPAPAAQAPASNSRLPDPAGGHGPTGSCAGRYPGRNVPRVDGALTTQPRAPAVPPARNTSAASMQSPPASADATRVSILSPVLARLGAAPRSTWLSTSSRISQMHRSTFLPLSTPLHSSLRWMGANEYECRHRQLRERLWIDRSPTEDSQATLEAFAMLPAARVGGDVPLIDAGGGLAAGRGRVSRLPRITPQSSSNIFKGHKPAFRWQADFPAGVTGGRQG